MSASQGTYYVAHRLFAPHDRILGAQVAAELAQHVGSDNVFLPYCDTDEETMVAEVKGRRLFELDQERLRHTRAMLALLHGPSFDDGVCMEVGFARRLGVPVVVLAADFQRYTLGESGLLTCPDPLIDAIVNLVVPLGTSSIQPIHANRFDDYAATTRHTLAASVTAAVQALVAVSEPGDAPSAGWQQGRDRDARTGAGRRLFVEPAPADHDQARAWVNELTDAGHTVKAAERFTTPNRSYPGDHSRDVNADPTERLLDAARRDWEHAAQSDTLIVNVEGAECPPGAAALIGAGLAQGSAIFAQYRSTVRTHAPGREPNYRNLMVQYAATGRFDVLADIAEDL